MIRANAGDYIEIRFTNLLPEYIEASPFQLKTLTDIVGYHIHLVKFDTIVSDGSANGWNNIAGARKYETLIERFFANEELNTVFFHDHLFANVHQQHGLFGAIIIEPTGALYYNGIRQTDENCNENAVIAAPGAETFREFVLFAHNGIRLLDKNNELIKTTEQELTGGETGHEAPDHEDTGEKGYNYRSERFLNRLKRIPAISKIFDSKAHGDPSTPLLKSYVGERVMIRLLMPADKPRNISFLLHDHRWRAQPNDPLSSIIPVQGAVSVGNVFNIEPEPAKCKGDYLYRSGSLRWDVESGMWGILRVMNRNIRCRCENACRRVTKRWKKNHDKK